ncbi:hypothetical protein FIBSPDRAFT_891947 [Athelia psychrophila]|uniref:Uncharacterized protein n=1 Tax=Athelia psychrophila TaxID=1759441 RepID=A0A166J2I5_9AGAM|nr:hypothetical protein FIBSPDRAFT_891947 [Fibularhizoctonia sp. CBS 109695]
MPSLGPLRVPLPCICVSAFLSTQIARRQITTACGDSQAGGRGKGTRARRGQRRPLIVLASSDDVTSTRIRTLWVLNFVNSSQLTSLLQPAPARHTVTDKPRPFRVENYNRSEHSMIAMKRSSHAAKLSGETRRHFTVLVRKHGEQDIDRLSFDYKDVTFSLGTVVASALGARSGSITILSAVSGNGGLVKKDG